ncbi:hypothetical protein PR048_003454 [Dryococelus australis]|uniref:Uncharacterized protein n=1 Tax=Dryococelus australis TaxID=614101 RepID=A0ABQ9IN30_9NEOP|nr:hypothetical protein PR048_003454 [Dryococelus australis]
MDPPLSSARNEGAIRATLTRTTSASSLLRARRYFVGSASPRDKCIRDVCDAPRDYVSSCQLNVIDILALSTSQTASDRMLAVIGYVDLSLNLGSGLVAILVSFFLDQASTRPWLRPRAKDDELEEKRAAREAASERKICDCEQQSSEKYDCRLDYWAGCEQSGEVCATYFGSIRESSALLGVSSSASSWASGDTASSDEFVIHQGQRKGRRDYDAAAMQGDSARGPQVTPRQFNNLVSENLEVTMNGPISTQIRNGVSVSVMWVHLLSDWLRKALGTGLVSDWLLCAAKGPPLAGMQDGQIRKIKRAVCCVLRQP